MYRSFSDAMGQKLLRWFQCPQQLYSCCICFTLNLTEGITWSNRFRGFDKIFGALYSIENFNLKRMFIWISDKKIQYFCEKLAFIFVKSTNRTLNWILNLIIYWTIWEKTCSVHLKLCQCIPDQFFCVLLLSIPLRVTNSSEKVLSKYWAWNSAPSSQAKNLTCRISRPPAYVDILFHQLISPIT